MEVTRDVILDLLPLYQAGEVSDDTRALVEKYLETDPELADAAKRTASAEQPEDIPVPITKEDQMEAYKEAKRLMLIKVIALAAIFSSSFIVIGLIILVSFFLSK